ncbi:unnamed protein product, partial [Closterium sp. NIES-54]
MPIARLFESQSPGRSRPFFTASTLYRVQKYEKVEGGKAEAKRAAKEQSKKAKRLKPTSRSTITPLFLSPVPRPPPVSFPRPLPSLRPSPSPLPTPQLRLPTPLLPPPPSPFLSSVRPSSSAAHLPGAAAAGVNVHPLWHSHSLPPSPYPPHPPLPFLVEPCSSTVQLAGAAAAGVNVQLSSLSYTSQALQAFQSGSFPPFPPFPPHSTPPFLPHLPSPPQLDPAAAQRTSQALQARQQQQEHGGGRGGAGGFGGGGFGSGGGGGGEGKKGGKGEMDDPMDQLLKEAGERTVMCSGGWWGVMVQGGGWCWLLVLVNLKWGGEGGKGRKGEGRKGGKGEMEDPMDQLLKEAGERAVMRGARWWVVVMQGGGVSDDAGGLEGKGCEVVGGGDASDWRGEPSFTSFPCPPVPLCLPGVGRKGRAADYQELRARLQQRLEELRKRRNAERASAASEWRKKQRETGAEGDTKGKKGGKERKKGKGGGEREGAVVGGKRKQEEREGDGGKEGKRERFGKEKGGGKGGRGGLVGAAAAGGGRAGGRGGEGHGLADDEVIPLDLEFGRVKLGDKAAAGPGMGGGKKGKKDGGKVSAKKLLEQAAKIQEKLKGRKLGDKALAEVETHLWNAASSRAAGGKVFDDPNMLSKQQKREQRQKEKSAKLWKERQMAVRKAMKDRQDKRKGNIQERKDNKIAAKIAR